MRAFSFASFAALLLVLSFSVRGQDVLLLNEDFETGGASFALNTGSVGSNSGDNQWIVNASYTGAPTYPNTTPQDQTNGGTISFAPYSNYLHIHDASSGITNNNYDATAASDRFAEMSAGLCTYGMEDVHFSFFYLSQGSATAYGKVYYSADGGPWTQIGAPLYNNQINWQYVDLSDPAFANVGSLRFGFRWENNAGSPPFTQSFSIDDVIVVGTYSEVDPVTINITGIGPNPVCQGSFLTIDWALSDTLCDGNYQIELSNILGNFPSPFNSWVMPINYPQTSGSVTIQIPNNAAVGDCYRIRINRLSPSPVIQGIASFCFEIMECPNVITTLQPVVTLDTNAVCIGSAIDIPFTSTGVYNNSNSYIAQLSEPDGTFSANPPIVGSNFDNGTYDPMLGQLPGSVGGLVPTVEPGCNYYIRIVSTSPQAIGSPWGPFCIQECDITTNNFQDLQFCVNDCNVDPDGENETIDIEVNTYDNIAQYLPGNVFTTQMLSSMDFSQIGSNGILGETAATESTTLDVHIPCKDSLPIYGIPLGMNYMRIVATNSSEPENSLGSLIRVTIGAYRNEPQVISSYEYPLFLPKDTFCVGETVYLSFQPYNYFDNSTFMWQCNAINGGQPFESPNGANSNGLFVLLGGPGVLTFSIQETNNGCVSPWTPPYTIVVLGNPAANITGPTTVCQGDTNLYQVPFSPNTYYGWTTNADLGEIAYQDTSNNVMNISFAETGIYTLSINVLNMCGSASDTHNVNVIAGPTADAGEDDLICIGQEATLQASTSPGLTYSWSDGNTSVGNGSNVTVSPEETTDYFLTVTNNIGCQRMDTIQVEVQYPDPPEVLIDSLCPGGLSSIVLSSPEPGSYEWSNGSTGSSIAVSDTGLYNLSVTVGGLLCPRLYDFDILPIEPEPAQHLTDSLCPGGNNEIQLVSPIQGTYIWSTGSNNPVITVSNPGDFALSVYQQGAVCPDLFEFHVEPLIPPAPVLLIDSVCPRGFYPIVLEADATGDYEWSTGEVAPSITVNDTGIYVLTIYIPDEPCPRTLEWTVHPDTCLSPPVLFCYVPNAITINGDGLNDVFGPEFSDISLVDEYYLQIFNRWGEKVFESNDPKAKWIANNSGSDYYVKDEVYVYMLEYRQLYNVERQKVNGHVVVLR